MAALVLCALAEAGCASWARSQESSIEYYYPHLDSETLGMTAEEHRQWVKQISAHDSRALMEDLDLLFLTDRPTRLTRWHTR